MKSLNSAIILALASLASLVAAQLGNLPPCSKGCATSALPAQCKLDVKCICSDSSFIDSISCCIKNACSDDDIQKTIQTADTFCKTAGVNLPTQLTCNSQSGGSSAAGASGSMSMAASSGASSQGSMASGMASSKASGGTSLAASAESATATGSSPVSSAASAATVSSTGGAAQGMGSNLGVVGAAVAALALF